jgi:uncharacterized repeat protein (TIGR01451 family)
MKFLVQKQGRRFLPFLGLGAILAAALLVGLVNVSAVHNEGLLEMDGNVAFNGGCGSSGTACGASNPDKITTAATFDWATAGAVKGVCKAGTGGDIAAESSPPAVVTASSCDKDYAQPDNTYHVGSDKDISDSNTWQCGGRPNAQDKTDILNAYAIQTQPSPSRTIDYFASERDTNNGTTFTGFWLFQASTACDASGNFGPGHTAGDVLLLFSYPSGGSTPSVAIFTWLHPAGVSTCAGTLFKSTLCPATPIAGNPLDCKAVSSVDTACGRANSGLPGDPGAFTPTWKTRATANQVIDVLDFVEAGVDMNAFFPNGIPCFSSLVAETRSSATPDATLKDFVIGQFDTCKSDVTVGKTSSVTSIDAGGSYDYTITVHNAGPGNASSVLVTDDLDNDLVVSAPVASTGSCSAVGAGNVISCSLGAIANGGSATITIHVTAPPAACGTVSNTSHVTAANDGNATNNDSNAVIVTIYCPSTSLDKTIDKIHVDYFITDTNDGNVSLSNPAVNDPVCQNSTPPSTPVYVSGDINPANGKLDPGESWKFKCTATFSGATGTDTNTATADGLTPANHHLTYCSDPAAPPANTLCDQDEKDSVSITVP